MSVAILAFVVFLFEPFYGCALPLGVPLFRWVPLGVFLPPFTVPTRSLDVLGECLFVVGYSMRYEGCRPEV